MDIEENHIAEKNEIEKDNILKGENLEVLAKSFNMKGFSWGMGIYIDMYHCSRRRDDG